MLAAQIIAKKRDSGILTDDEIQFMVRGLVDGSIPDYQIAAWAMAVLCRGMTTAETSCLTQCMLDSGSRLARQSDRPRVDKHSTGGLGDKVSLILAPLVACFDVEVPMLSGRGLGITGGTLDKLESYSGFRTDLSQSEISMCLAKTGCVITGTTPDTAPADKKLYALRDVTGTVPSIPLITASILSKKLAENLNMLVLDVKFGSGSFMKTPSEASALASSLKETAQQLGLPSTAVLSSMEQPLGNMIGNACEINEAVEVLRGEKNGDVLELTLVLSAALLTATGVAVSPAEARSLLQAAIDDGRAFERYVQMVEGQGAKFSETLHLEKPHTVEATSDGWIAEIDGEAIGQTIIQLGGGRRQIGDTLNHKVGIEMLVGIGNQVNTGQPLARLFTNSASSLEASREKVRQAITIAEHSTAPIMLIPSSPFPSSAPQGEARTP